MRLPNLSKKEEREIRSQDELERKAETAWEYGQYRINISHRFVIAAIEKSLPETGENIHNVSHHFPHHPFSRGPPFLCNDSPPFLFEKRKKITKIPIDLDRLSLYTTLPDRLSVLTLVFPLPYKGRPPSTTNTGVNTSAEISLANLAI